MDMVISKEKLGRGAALYGSFLYLEIILILPSLSITAGRPAAIMTGLLLSLVLSYHLFKLYTDPISRWLHHLILMDIHGAWSLATIAAALYVLAFGSSPLNGMAAAVRGVYGAGEVALIFFFTRE